MAQVEPDQRLCNIVSRVGELESTYRSGVINLKFEGNWAPVNGEGQHGQTWRLKAQQAFVGSSRARLGKSEHSELRSWANKAAKGDVAYG